MLEEYGYRASKRKLAQIFIPHDGLNFVGERDALCAVEVFDVDPFWRMYSNTSRRAENIMTRSTTLIPLTGISALSMHRFRCNDPRFAAL